MKGDCSTFIKIISIFPELPPAVTSTTTSDSNNVISWTSRSVSLREMMRRATAAVSRSS